jgi:tripartite-type tricarboxylate transporter receptor subunit TctC
MTQEKFGRRTFQRLALILFSATSLDLYANSAFAEYPTKTVNIYVGLAAGGIGDVMARILGNKLSEKWHQSVVVINKPGANTTIEDSFVAHSAPDGYTLAVDSMTHVIAPITLKVDYDPIKSFTPIALIDTQSSVLVANPVGVPVKTLSEFVAYAKANPGKLNYISTGTGSPPNLFMAVLMSRTDINIVPVQYQGTGGPGKTALLGNEVQLGWVTTTQVVDDIKAGTLRALAVSSKKRSDLLPDVPSLAEALNMPDIDLSIWNAVVGPAGMSPDLVKQLNTEINAALRSPEVRDSYLKAGLEPSESTPEQALEKFEKEYAYWTAICKQLGIAIEQ